MAWETNENGLIVDEKGNPIWVNEAGEKKSVDYAAMANGLRESSQQAAKRKEELRSLQDRYSVFAEIDDLTAWHAEAQKALEMARSAPDAAKDLEEQIQLRLKPTKEGYEEKLKAKDKALSDREKEMAALTSQYHQEKKQNSFSMSAFVREKLTSPTLAYKLFADNFSIQDGKIVGTYDSGEVIYDNGEIASFDLALAKLVEASPDRGLLLKGSSANGSGANPNGGGGGGKMSARNVTEIKSLNEQAAYIKEKYGS